MFCEPAYSLPSDEKEPYSSSPQIQLAKKKPRLAFGARRGCGREKREDCRQTGEADRRRWWLLFPSIFASIRPGEL